MTPSSVIDIGLAQGGDPVPAIAAELADALDEIEARWNIGEDECSLSESFRLRLLTRRLAQTPARTAAGLAAKAQVLLRSLETDAQGHEWLDEPDEALLVSLLRDVVAMRRG